TNNKQAAPEQEQKENKSVKEQFENHPVVFGGSLLLAGLLSGIGLMKFIFPPETKQLVTTSTLQPVNIECKIEGLLPVSEAHNKRVSSIQSKILILETQAIVRTLTNTSQVNYINSANRLRSDIETENNIFNKATEKLQAKCQEMLNKLSND
ncbi:MAG: hypothetical protein HRU40_21770, partial [Saprospiraceae bacterium]|nr:hypothetical protein [Saprospiraceae bacterium]